MADNHIDCSCKTPPFYYLDFKNCEVGIDNSFGHYCDVSIEKCNKCNRLWLRYFMEEEWHSKSGRWFRGMISEEEAKNIQPETALGLLEKMDFVIYGGSYFDSTGMKGNGKAVTNHFNLYRRTIL